MSCSHPGVGWSMTRKLSKMGVENCGDLQKLPLSALQKEFGPKTGQSLYCFCRGEDDRPIRTERERKSVSAEVNYGIRFQNVSFFSCIQFTTHVFPCIGVWSFLTCNLILLVGTWMAGWFDV